MDQRPSRTGRPRPRRRSSGQLARDAALRRIGATRRSAAAATAVLTAGFAWLVGDIAPGHHASAATTPTTTDAAAASVSLRMPPPASAAALGLSPRHAGATAHRHLAAPAVASTTPAAASTTAAPASTTATPAPAPVVSVPPPVVAGPPVVSGGS
jgi:hypothetical protein